MDNEYVLAMYDIRGKQEYIYRSNRIKAIVGASAIIRDCFEDYLYPSAVEFRNNLYACDSRESAIYDYCKEDTNFSVDEFRKRMAADRYIGEIIYSGGGNFFVLYKDKKVCIEVNKLFTKKLLTDTCTLKVICTYIENVNFQQYQEDQRRLYEKHRFHEAKEAPSIPAQVLPFTQVDYQFSMPLYKTQAVSRSPLVEEKVNREEFFKFEKYWEIEREERDCFGERQMDKLITQKGEESLLAIVYIDGNNMGAKVQSCLDDTDKSYESCIRALRRFSKDIQKNYITDRMADIDKKLEEKYSGVQEKRKRRFVIYAGDEITLICNARDAFDIAKTYLTNLPPNNSACAGIAIFHSHAPYSEVYRIAQQCCESGKCKMKEERIEDANLLDVHYCQSGIGIDLESIREKEAGTLISKPWFLEPPKEKVSDYVTVEMIEELAGELRKTGRSNIKSLADYAKKGLTALQMDLKRIQAHSEQKLDFTLGGKIDDNRMRCMIYDIVILYDLWFADADNGGGGKQ